MKLFFLLFFVFFLVSLSSLVYSSSLDSDPILLPRPLILEFPSPNIEEDAQLRCDSWRVSAEANNVAPWRAIPAECAEYVKDYMVGKKYRFDLEMVSSESAAFARSVEMVGDGRDAWVFDVDETLLSNLPYYADHQFGLELFNGHEFDKWVNTGMAPAIQPSLKLYEEVLQLGFKIFLLTGRSESQRVITTDNLITVGFRDWEKLILRELNDHGKTAMTYKSEKRSEIVVDGYRILGNSGDQWSDLLGSATSDRSFKLPNPMYFIS